MVTAARMLLKTTALKVDKASSTRKTDLMPAFLQLGKTKVFLQRLR